MLSPVNGRNMTASGTDQTISICSHSPIRRGSRRRRYLACLIPFSIAPRPPETWRRSRCSPTQP